MKANRANKKETSQEKETPMGVLFETKKINMETLPEYLKDTRESFSYDLKYVAKITGISEKFLQSLEQGYYHRLPADVYIYGFLRKLGELYRVDAGLLIAQYKKERGIHENINKGKFAATRDAYRVSDPYAKYKPARFVLTPKSMALLLVSCFVLFVLGYLVYQVRAINRPPAIMLDEPADGQVVQSSSVLIQGHTGVGVSLSMNDQEIFVDGTGNFKQLMGINPGHNTLNFVAKSTFGKQSTKQISVIADFQNPVPQGAINLVVTVKSVSTQITVTIDGGAPQDIIFQPDQSRSFTGQNQILISTADAGHTYVQLNGKDLGALGKDGQSLKEVPFTGASSK